ncbi:MAG TPA: HAD family hydrolase [Zeimonas sp.]
MGEVAERAARVRLVALDVDGTLTDGRLFIGGDGEAMKSFSVRDGFGLTLLREAGIHVALVTARRSTIVQARAAELHIDDVRQGVPDKAQALRELCEQRATPLAECAFVGDDWPDLRAMSIAGLAATVLDAPREVRERAHWVSTLPAGRGAVREFAEFVLRAKGLFDAMLAHRTGAVGRPDDAGAAGNAGSSPGDLP